MGHDNVYIVISSLKQIQHDKDKNIWIYEWSPFYMPSRPQNINGTVGFVYFSWLNMALTNEKDFKMYCPLSLALLSNK